MVKENNEEINVESAEETSDEIREEETSDEICEEETSHEIREEETLDEILAKVHMNNYEIENRFSALEEKIDNMISMLVDSGATIQNSIDDISEEKADDYEDDFINIDEMDLSI